MRVGTQANYGSNWVCATDGGRGEPFRFDVVYSNTTDGLATIQVQPRFWTLGLFFELIYLAAISRLAKKWLQPKPVEDEHFG
ncbi:MAG: hypothetical protein ABSF16_04045 [Terracidiphilus sp.]|jgi:hypothetical protein